MQQQLEIMLSMQNDMNTKVNTDWVTKGFAWYRAIWIESAEMLDHYGWKWWKKQTPDIDQVVLELVDIWHFGLSILILEGAKADAIEAKLQTSLSQTGDKEFGEALEQFVAVTLQTKSFDIEGFAALMNTINLSFDELYVRYVGKNVLNFFRQDHGYKDGSYRKEWGGREDNEHLVELSNSLDSAASDYKDRLYDALKRRYDETAPA
ncbi:dUTP diphosphatase [Aurantivibrio plasticivorans]